MRKVNLKDYVITLESGSRPKGGATSSGIPSLGGEHINNYGGLDLDEKKLKYVTEEYFNNMKSGKIKKEDILIVKDGATTGKCAYVGDDFKLKKACVNEHVFILRVNSNIISKYLFYYLYSPKGQVNILKDFRGATVGGISKDFVDMEIYLPDLQVQHKIVQVLDKAQSLIDKRKEQIKQCDELVKSLFYDMFGDPFVKRNAFIWDKLDNVTIINPNKTEIAEKNFNEKVSFIPMENVGVNGEIITNQLKTIEEVYNGYTYFREGDVLFAKITPCMENGKGAIAKNLYNGIGFGSTEFHVLRPIKDISTSAWIFYLTKLNKFRKIAEMKMTGSVGQKRVPVSFLKEIYVSIPSLELQNKFAEKVQKIEEIRQRLQKSLSLLEDNFNSLMQKAFNGELFQ